MVHSVRSEAMKSLDISGQNLFTLADGSLCRTAAPWRFVNLDPAQCAKKRPKLLQLKHGPTNSDCYDEQ